MLLPSDYANGSPGPMLGRWYRGRFPFSCERARESSILGFKSRGCKEQKSWFHSPCSDQLKERRGGLVSLKPAESCHVSRAEVQERRPAIAASEGPRGEKPAPAHSAARRRMAENLYGRLFSHTPSLSLTRSAFL